MPIAEKGKPEIAECLPAKRLSSSASRHASMAGQTGRIEQANVSFYDGAGRSFPGPSSQELGDPSHQGQSQGQETRAA